MKYIFMIFTMMINMCFINFNNIANSNMPVEYYFSKLPENVQTAFYKDGWTYEKVDYSLGDMYYNGKKQISGRIDWDDKIIYIDNRQSANKSILHEVGHRFEYEPYVKGPNSTEFKTLYNNNWSEWYVKYGGHINNYYSLEEAYANLYEIYFLKPNCLDSQTKSFIEQELQSIK